MSYEITFKEKTGYDLNKFYKKYYPKLNYYLSKYGLSSEDQEHIANQAFMQSLDKIDMYNPQYHYSTWLFIIARNLALQEIKNRKKNIIIDYNDESFENEDRNIKYQINNISKENDALTRLKYSLTIKEIYNLDSKYKYIMILRELKKKTYDEICVMTNLSLQTVKNRIHSGRQILGKKLKPVFNDIIENYDFETCEN